VPSADTPAPSRAPRAHALRLVLLAALAAGLGGLALPSGPSPALVASASAGDRASEPVLRPTVAVAPLVVPAPTRRPVRVSRSRPLTPLWVRPVSAPMNSPYGPRWGAMHPGIDFAAHYGTPIHVVGDGVVLGAGYLPGESGYGQIVLVRHAGGVITAYAHMSRVLAHAGEHVHAGDVLGLVGATGHVTGPHLHFEVRIGGRKVNPVPWLRAHGIRV
jgi:murein DD-endopeptidase MepM/ murein hydrolase activator NlpD